MAKLRRRARPSWFFVVYKLQDLGDGINRNRLHGCPVPAVSAIPRAFLSTTMMGLDQPE